MLFVSASTVYPVISFAVSWYVALNVFPVFSSLPANSFPVPFSKYFTV